MMCSICSGVALSDIFTITEGILSGLRPKNKSRDLRSRRWMRNFELSILSRLAPVLHLRRTGKPIAAESAGGAKSRHNGPNKRKMLTRVLLVQGIGNAGERIIGIGADQTHRTDHQHQDHCQHDRVLGNVLPLLVRPQISAKLKHSEPPSPRRGEEAKQPGSNNADSDPDCQSK